MTAAGVLSITTARVVTAGERTQIEAVDRAAALADAVPALDDQVRLDLRYGNESVCHLLGRRTDADTVVAYGCLRLVGAPAVGHLVVDPRFRRTGAGSALLTEMRKLAGADGLHVWAHADLPAARRLAEKAGLHRAREVLRMHRQLTGPLPVVDYSPGVAVRTFVPGRDNAAWLRLNAAAFADHHEQGALTAAGLAQRIASPDFDPGGFFVAERDAEMVGFHWTKVHPAGELGPEPVGEVYVLGVDPAAQGSGLGKALTLTGLRFLQAQRLSSVILYVEAANAPAIAVYSRLGFARAATDVVYAS